MHRLDRRYLLTREVLHLLWDWHLYDLRILGGSLLLGGGGVGGHSWLLLLLGLRWESLLDLQLWGGFLELDAATSPVAWSSPITTFAPSSASLALSSSSLSSVLLPSSSSSSSSIALRGFLAFSSLSSTRSSLLSPKGPLFPSLFPSLFDLGGFLLLCLFLCQFLLPSGFSGSFLFFFLLFLTLFLLSLSLGSLLFELFLGLFFFSALSLLLSRGLSFLLFLKLPSSLSLLSGIRSSFLSGLSLFLFPLLFNLSSNFSCFLRGLNSLALFLGCEGGCFFSLFLPL